MALCLLDREGVSIKVALRCHLNDQLAQCDQSCRDSGSSVPGTFPRRILSLTTAGCLQELRMHSWRLYRSIDITDALHVQARMTHAACAAWKSGCTLQIFLGSRKDYGQIFIPRFIDTGRGLAEAQSYNDEQGLSTSRFILASLTIMHSAIRPRPTS